MTTLGTVASDKSIFEVSEHESPKYTTEIFTILIERLLQQDCAFTTVNIYWCLIYKWEIYHYVLLTNYNTFDSRSGCSMAHTSDESTGVSQEVESRPISKRCKSLILN